MDRSNIITLIKEIKARDALGVNQTQEKPRNVFCNVSSVTASEFFEGGRSGLNPSYRMTMFAGDYEGEKILEYNCERYAIYRTYLKGTDTIELYVERKGGTNGKQEVHTRTAPASNSVNTE